MQSASVGGVGHLLDKLLVEGDRVESADLIPEGLPAPHVAIVVAD